jgi:hypothetical protein
MEHFLNRLTEDSWVVLAPLLSGRLPGRVDRVATTGNLYIKSLIPLSYRDGSSAHIFFAFQENVKGIQGLLRPGDIVTFLWSEPGQRRHIRARNEYGEPQAVEVEASKDSEVNQLVKDFQERLSTELRQELERWKVELQTQQDKLDQLIAERIKDKVEEINKQKVELQEETAKVQQQEAKLKADFEEQEAQLLAELEQKQQSIASWEQSVKSFADSIEGAKTEINHLRKAIEPYRLAVPLSVEEQPPQPSEVSPLPQNLAENWGAMLEAVGLLLPQNIATSYLLSLVSACYSGSIVLLNGPVGVGKTSIIKNSAKLLDGTSKIIPVRPAWLDPSDLLGFFDPLSETFRPSPFLTALKDAKTQCDRLCLVCLDELNLARIENYGADLLSSLEYSRSRQKEQSFSNNDERQGLLLYSPSIETQLWEEARFLHELTDRTHEQTQRLKHIQTLLNDYPSTFTLAPNLVLLGTLNSDETTYDLSPKVIDRSYVITYPPANLTKTSAAADISSATTAILSITALQQAIASAEEFNQKSNEWQLILRWNQQYLSVLGIPLGHRASREYQVFHTVATILGLSSRDCLGHFIFTKLLPRISFFKNDITSELFNRWLQELEQAYKPYDPGDVLPQLSKQMQDKRRANVRYWTKA